MDHPAHGGGEAADVDVEDSNSRILTALRLIFTEILKLIFKIFRLTIIRTEEEKNIKHFCEISLKKISDFDRNKKI